MGGECGLRGEEKKNGAHNANHIASRMCSMDVMSDGKARRSKYNSSMLPKGAIHYIEKFTVLRMNAAGFLFGISENIMHTPGWDTRRVNHDEAANSYQWGVFNHKAENFQ